MEPDASSERHPERWSLGRLVRFSFFSSPEDKDRRPGGAASRSVGRLERRPPSLRRQPSAPDHEPSTTGTDHRPPTTLTPSRSVAFEEAPSLAPDQPRPRPIARP